MRRKRSANLRTRPRRRTRRTRKAVGAVPTVPSRPRASRTKRRTRGARQTAVRPRRRKARGGLDFAKLEEKQLLVVTRDTDGYTRINDDEIKGEQFREHDYVRCLSTAGAGEDRYAVVNKLNLKEERSTDADIYYIPCRSADKRLSDDKRDNLRLATPQEVQMQKDVETIINWEVPADVFVCIHVLQSAFPNVKIVQLKNNTQYTEETMKARSESIITLQNVTQYTEDTMKTQAEAAIRIIKLLISLPHIEAQVSLSILDYILKFFKNITLVTNSLLGSRDDISRILAAARNSTPAEALELINDDRGMVASQ